MLSMICKEQSILSRLEGAHILVKETECEQIILTWHEMCPNRDTSRRTLWKGLMDMVTLEF